MEKWHFYDQTKTSAEIVKMLYWTFTMLPAVITQ